MFFRKCQRRAEAVPAAARMKLGLGRGGGGCGAEREAWPCTRLCMRAGAA